MRQGYTIVWCGWQGDLMPINELARARRSGRDEPWQTDREQGPH